jgi:hypothetical protein
VDYCVDDVSTERATSASRRAQLNCNLIGRRRLKTRDHHNEPISKLNRSNRFRYSVGVRLQPIASNQLPHRLAARASTQGQLNSDAIRLNVKQREPPQQSKIIVIKRKFRLLNSDLVVFARPITIFSALENTRVGSGNEN